MKKVLITGAKSYIGENVRDYLLKSPYSYSVDIIDTNGLDPNPELFSSYDVVFNVAGIAHIKETDENRHLFFDINRDLVFNIAKAAKAGGVKQFIILSTMAVYGMLTGHITKVSKPNPNTTYGESKYKADEEIMTLVDENFKFACLRPPMVYGKGCKGNYQILRSFTLKSPVFPKYDNKRSMVYIGNLCEFVKECIDKEMGGLFFPQNAEYVKTYEMVRLIAEENGKKIRLTKAFNWLLKMMPVGTIKKVFGDLTYEPVDLVSKYGFEKTVKMTER